jgi:hypothetical protein
VIKKLIKLANHLDSRGLVKEADALDEIIEEELNPPKEDGIASAVNKILKPGFDVLGHGTSINNAGNILEVGFSLYGNPLNRTFLSMSADGDPTIGEQLKLWPYGESSNDGSSVGVAIMRIPKNMVGVYDWTELTKMVSTPPKMAPKPIEEDPFLGQISRMEERNFDEERNIPSFFFFAIWDVKNSVLTTNPNYDETKILEHLNLDESAIAALEPTQQLPTWTMSTEDSDTMSPEDSDYDVF